VDKEDEVVRPEDQKVFAHFIVEISRESDRGLALIGAAFIDERLADTLQAFFCKDAAGLLHGKNAPLGSFSARIEACHALALIEDVEQNECDYIRRIRNEFAHKVITTSFAEQRISDLCTNFKSPLPEPDLATTTPARFRFQNAIITMASRLFYRAEYVAREKRVPKVWVDPNTVRWRRTSDELPPDGKPVIGAWMPGYEAP
jgi:mannitol operon repressor